MFWCARSIKMRTILKQHLAFVFPDLTALQNSSESWWTKVWVLNFLVWRPVALWLRPVEGWRRWQREQAGDLMRPDFCFVFLVMHLGLGFHISFWEIFMNFSYLNLCFMIGSADVGLQRDGTVVMFHDNVVRNWECFWCQPSWPMSSVALLDWMKPNMMEGGAQINDDLFSAILYKNLSHRGVGPTLKGWFNGGSVLSGKPLECISI